MSIVSPKKNTNLNVAADAFKKSSLDDTNKIEFMKPVKKLKNSKTNRQNLDSTEKLEQNLMTEVTNKAGSLTDNSVQEPSAGKYMLTPNAIVRGDKMVPNDKDSSMIIASPSPNHDTDVDQNTLLMSKYTNRNNPKALMSDRKDWNQQTSIRSEDTNCRQGRGIKRNENPTWLSSPDTNRGGYGPPT